MNIAVVYESLSGNTKEIAEEIKEACSKNHTVILLSAKEALEANINHAKIDLHFLGTWTNKGDCGDSIKLFAKQLDYSKVALFQTSGYGNSTEYYKALEKRFIAALPENTQILGTFYCQGKMPISVRNRSVSLLRANPQDAQLEINIKNFDTATTHPDKHDLANAKLFAHTILHQFDTKF
jgi:flavodoxin